MPIKKKSTRRQGGARSDYRIPALWDCWGATRGVVARGSEVIIDPPAYLRECLAWIRDHQEIRVDSAGRSLSQLQGMRRAGRLRVRDGKSTRRAGDWIRQGFMYGLMVRCATAWDHDGDGRLSSRRCNELGTFLKTILLLPHLQRMGVNVLYMLPVVKASRLYRKGELGCPYAAKNFLQLDPDQYDDAFGKSYGDINDQFRLLVSCAHGLGMRVMLDIAPRTAARDCDWILDHPEWFYWIDRRCARDYRAPHVPGVTYYNPIPGRLDEIYDVPAVRAHLAKFRFAPSVTAPQKWANFAAAAKRRPPENLLKEIARHFGVITPPGFSDVVNDTQPPWSDVTYLRLFEDHPRAAIPHLPDPAAQPPYVLYDTAKASLFEGRKPQRALWEQLAGILPFYQSFGIDGARVDMAHALPRRLEAMILENPRKLDPDFCLLAEELGTGNHARVRRAGYNLIIGPSWWMQPRGHEGKMHEFLKEIPKLAVPVMAAAETPDTPRAVVRRGQRKFARQAAVVNCFLPNAVPMVNGGMEVHERQPMNLGLDAKPRNRFALPKTDPLYGKLAFFDRYALHWTNPGAAQMTDLIARAAQVRRDFLVTLTNPRAYFAPRVALNARRIISTGFRLPRNEGMLVLLANLDYQRRRRAVIRGLPARLAECELVFSICDVLPPRLAHRQLALMLEPGETLALRLR